MRNFLRGTITSAMLLLFVVGCCHRCPEGRAEPAPLTQLTIAKVRSQKSNAWNAVRPDQLVTDIDHGGEWLRVITREVGDVETVHLTFDGWAFRQVRAEPLKNSRGECMGIEREWRLPREFQSGRLVFSALGERTRVETLGLVDIWVR